MKDRIDRVIVERNRELSRERVQSLIMEGRVLVNMVPVTKPGALVSADADIVIRMPDIPYVSRGGMKLEAALTHFGITVTEKTAMDVGSSTGGFTDCLLKKGALKVYCIDVGYGQLAWSLRNDPRVILLERTNIRHLERESIQDAIDIATIDVSFISLKKVIPVVMLFLKNGGEMLALVKPQFEVGKGEVGKGGIVRDEAKRQATIDSVRDFSEGIGLETIGVFQSPVAGQKGNREYFLSMRKP